MADTPTLDDTDFGAEPIAAPAVAAAQNRAFVPRLSTTDFAAAPMQSSANALTATPVARKMTMSELAADPFGNSSAFLAQTYQDARTDMGPQIAEAKRQTDEYRANYASTLAEETAKLKQAAIASQLPPAWVSLSSSPEFAAASETRKEILRREFRDKQLAQSLVVGTLPKDVDAAKAEFDKNVPAYKVTRSYSDAAVDTGVSLMGGFAGVVKNIADVYGLSTGYTDNLVSAAARDAVKFWDNLKSETLKLKEGDRAAAVAKAEGFFDELKTSLGATIKDPALLSSFLVSQIPQIFPGMAIGRLAGAAGKAAGIAEGAASKVALGSSIGTGALLQGADVGGDNYEAAAKYLKTTHPNMAEKDRHEIALASARKTALSAAMISVATNAMPGGASLEKALLGQFTGKGGVIGAVKGLLKEAGTESIEEGGSKVASNKFLQDVDPSTLWWRGAGEAAGLGALGGGVLGGVAGLKGDGKPAPQTDKPTNETAPTTPKPDTDDKGPAFAEWARTHPEYAKALGGDETAKAKLYDEAPPELFAYITQQKINDKDAIDESIRASNTQKNGESTGGNAGRAASDQSQVQPNPGNQRNGSGQAESGGNGSIPQAGQTVAVRSTAVGGAQPGSTADSESGKRPIDAASVDGLAGADRIATGGQADQRAVLGARYIGGEDGNTPNSTAINRILNKTTGGLRITVDSLSAVADLHTESYKQFLADNGDPVAQDIEGFKAATLANLIERAADRAMPGAQVAEIKAISKGIRLPRFAGNETGYFAAQTAIKNNDIAALNKAAGRNISRATLRLAVKDDGTPESSNGSDAAQATASDATSGKRSGAPRIGPYASLTQAIRKLGGLSPSVASDITGENAKKANKIRGLSGLFRDGGRTVDELVESGMLDAYLPPAMRTDLVDNDNPTNMDEAVEYITNLLNSGDARSTRRYGQQEAAQQSADLARAKSERQPSLSRDKGESVQAWREREFDHWKETGESGFGWMEGYSEFASALDNLTDAESAIFDTVDFTRKENAEPNQSAAVASNSESNSSNAKVAASPSKAVDEAGSQLAQEERPSLDLAPQSEAQARGQDAQQRRDAAEKGARDNAPRPEDFLMVGSNRAADVGAAAGQNTLFAPKSNYGQRDLFADAVPDSQRANLVERLDTPMPDGISATAVIDRAQQRDLPGVYTTGVKLSDGVKRKSDVNRIQTLRDVALATRSLSDLPREHLDVVVTSEAGNILAMQRMFAGAQSQAAVYPQEVIKFVTSIKGAAKYYLSHNHPSDNQTLSYADKQLSKSFNTKSNGVGPSYEGIVAVTENGYSEFSAYGLEKTGALEPRTNAYEITYLEETIEKRGALGPAINLPIDAIDAFTAIAKGLQGVIFLDGQSRPTGFFPVTMRAARELRNTELARDIIAASYKSRAASAIISTQRGGVAPQQYSGSDANDGARNIGALLARVDVNVVDIIDNGASRRNVGAPLANELLFSRKPATIEVDGVDRPTANSNGKPIANNSAKLRSFWKWFGDSKVVDEQGRPVVVYHGTDKTFNKINMRKGAQGLFWFTSDKSAIEAGEVGAQGSGKIMELYAKIESPADWKQYEQLLIMEFKGRGLDGAILPDGDGTFTGFALRGIQLKSATGNNGDYSLDNNDIRFSRTEPAPLWRSVLTDAISKAPFKETPANQWKAWLQSNAAKLGVKKDEIEWSGVNEWLDLQTGKVTRDQVQAYLDANGVRVTETELGAETPLDVRRKITELQIDYSLKTTEVADAKRAMDGAPVREFKERREEIMRLSVERDDISERLKKAEKESIDPAKYTQYQLPGGENYRELLLTLPEKGQRGEPVSFAKWADLTGNEDTPEARREWRNSSAMDENQPSDQNFKSSHWDQPNILAHIRFNERTDSDGKKVLFIEEIQSDWGQAGKKSGFSGDAPERFTVIDKRGAQGFQRGDFGSRAEAEAYQRSNSIGVTPNNSEVRAVKVDSAIPRAPFVGKTEAWVSLALKRIIRYAVDNGFDRVAMVNGEQSAERYDLSKQIDSIVYGDDNSLVARDKNGNTVLGKTVKEADLEDTIGKEVAKKLLETKPNADGERVLKNADLKVGGEGMKAFYDKIVPSVANDVLKKLGGGKVGVVEVGKGGWDVYRTDERTDEPELVRANVKTEALANDIASDYIGWHVKQAQGQQPGFDITDKMKEKSAQGMPLFRLDAAQPKPEQSQVAQAVIDAVSNNIDGVILQTFATPQEAAAHFGVDIPDDARGLFYQGEVALIVANITGKLDAEFVLWHELLHAGLTKYAPRDGAKYRKLLTELSARNANITKAANKWHKSYGEETINLYIGMGRTRAQATSQSKLIAIEEALADLSGANVKLNGMAGFVAKLQGILRSLGFNELANWVEGKTDAEALQLVSKARDAITSKGAQYLSQVPAFARDVATIKVDGVYRSTRNSENQPIADNLAKLQNFWRYFKDSKTVDYQGRPLVLYHGTTSDFTKFDRAFANPESDLGSGFYATNNPDDVGSNYAGKGPDLTAKMERFAQTLESSDDMSREDMSREEAQEAARQRFMQNDGFTMPIYAALQNPVVIGSNQPTFFNYNEEYNEKLDEYAEPTGTVIDFVDALRLYNDDRYGDVDIERVISDIFSGLDGETDITAERLIEIAKTGEGMAYATDNESDNGDLASAEIIRQAFERMGFDGYIDYTVNEKFGSQKRIGKPMAGMDEDTVHYVAFEPTQLKSALGNSGAFSTASPDIRYSRAVQTTGDLLASAASKSLTVAPLANQDGFIERAKTAIATRFADHLVPVQNALRKLPISDLMKQRVIGSLYRAPGVKMALEKEALDTYLEPIRKQINAIAKATGMSYEASEQKFSQWATAQYAPEGNAHLIRRDAQAVVDLRAELANLQSAAQTGASPGLALRIASAQNDLNNAIADQRKRVVAINAPTANANGTIGSSTNPHAFGVAGGMNNAQAAQVSASVQANIPVAMLKAAQKDLRNMLDWKLDKDVKSGRTNPAMAATFRKDMPNYIPTTGDPNQTAQDGDIPTGSGTVNQAKDKAMEGRLTSVADGALKAATDAVIKSAAYSGMGDFKGNLNAIWENAVSDYVAQGQPVRDAQTLAAAALGFRRTRQTAIQKTSDNVLILRRDGENYVFAFDNEEIVPAIKRDTLEDVPSLLKPIAKATSLYGRAVTQFMPLFAPVNTIRDVWEKSEIVRTRKLLDAKGKKINSNAVARQALLYAVDPATWQASGGKSANTSGNSQARQDLNDLLELGGQSTWGSLFNRSFEDMVDKLKTQNRIDKKTLATLLKVTETYNNTFDMVSALSSYRAMLDAGMTKQDAASATLDLTNFRKQGTYMGPIKALYVFSGPAAIGAQNLTQYLSTRTGQVRFTAYLIAMTALYAMIRAGDDEDEAGRKKVDTLGSFVTERSIPMPVGDGEYAKVPVGFGPSMLALGLAVNLVRFFAGEQSGLDTTAEAIKLSTKTLSPVQPNEISVSKYPGTYIAQLLSPTILKPITYVVGDRDAFGRRMTPEFPNKSKLLADQGQRSTIDFYKDVARELQRNMGMDVTPEQAKTFIEGYLVGPFRYWITNSPLS